MAYQVLARKYRPQRFSDVVGQDHVTRTLLNALAQGRIAHGYIFSGHRGIGKTTIARILAMALNCRTEIGTDARPTPEPCGICVSCTEVRAGNAVDVIEIDAATNRGIDEIRELRDAARYRPARDRYKIYILDEAHQITDAAFNALLKTLEEPPDHVVFMMATTQPEDIPQTIRSRCQHFSFHAVKFDDILIQLRTIAAEEQIATDDEALALLAEAGDGSMRDALSIMDQAIASAPVINGQAALDAAQIRELMGSVPNTVFERLLEAIGENQSAPVIAEINRLLNAGNSASQLARQFVRYLRNVLMARIAGEQTELLQLSPDERARAGRSALLFSEEDLTRFLSVMLRTFDELNYRQEPRFHLELGLLKLVHLQRLLPVEQLLSQLGGAAARVWGGPLPSPSGSRPSSPSRLSAVPVTAPTTAPAASRSAPPPRHEPDATPAAAPAFSPFEQDRKRKESEPSNPTAAPSSSPVTKPSPELPARDAPEPAAAEPASPIHAHQQVESALPPEADGPAPLPSELPSAPTLDAIRDRVCEALDQAGLNTAVTLLQNGVWSEEGDSILVQVGVKKTMLGLTINPEAEKVCREAIRSLLGKPRPLTFVPGEAGAAPPPSARRPASTGSVQARAMEHPLVRQAQELFQAEVRSVVDLRTK
jgi:DNA polymerase-3 subunit gamma/tau